MARVVTLNLVHSVVRFLCLCGINFSSDTSYGEIYKYCHPYLFLVYQMPTIDQKQIGIFLHPNIL